MKFEGQSENPNKEQVVEKQKEIVSTARKERFLIGWNVFKKLVLHIIDITPLGNLKMIPEALVGKTLAGRPLTKNDRMMYALIVLHSSTYTALLSYGVFKGNEQAVMLSFPVYLATVGLSYKQKRGQIKQDAEEIKLKKQELVETLAQSKKIIEEYGEENVKELIEKVEKSRSEPDDDK